MDRIVVMKAFVTVAQERSFTKAADKLDSSSQLVSRHVSQLEEHLGVRLFNRTTRKVHLTEAGEQCFEHARQILASVEDMESHIGQLKGSVKGVLNISAPVSFSTLHLSPLLRDFKKQYPEVGIHLELSDRKVDVVEEGFDVALRIGSLKNSSLIAKKIAPIRLALCASEDYLKANGVPEHPDELNPAHYLRYSYTEQTQSDQPLLAVLRTISLQNSSSLNVNNGEVLAAAAIAGEGYVLQPTFIVGQAIKQGTLKVILSEYEPQALALYAVYPHRKLLAPKLRAFIDFIADYYGQPPYWDDF